MSFNYDLWSQCHSDCVEKVKRLCGLNQTKDSIKNSVKCNSTLCVICNAMQDIRGYFQNNIKSSAELCFLIRNIDVIVTGILDINHILFGIGLNKQAKAIERCFTDEKTINSFRTLRSLILAHPVDTQYINDRGEPVTVYLEDFRPFNPICDGFLVKEKCDYVKRMCKPESDLSYFEPLSISKDIVPVINTIIDSVELLNSNTDKQIALAEFNLSEIALNIDNSSIERYIRSLDKELEKRYPSAVENAEYKNGETHHYSIIGECLMYFDAHFSDETQEKYNIFLKYVKSELKRIENDLQTMSFDEDKYFRLLYNPEFAPSLSYEKEKMEYLRDSNSASYTNESIDSNTPSNELWGVRCFRILEPYIMEYIPVDTSVSDKELYCQYIAAQYLSNKE